MSSCAICGKELKKEEVCNCKSKEFYGGISITMRVDFAIKAKSEEEAKEKIFDISCLELNLQDDEGKKLKNFEITNIDWELVKSASRGNVSQSYIEDFEIEELK
ncbi:TPA: hypothetical protein I9080_002919 [Clostridium perfringens]|uniref:Uncharacterized protein n=1 Tax=Clostridium perfringens TaxID=1502 RepID=A0A8H9UYJ5_CLOPF|nr:hypothetical protein [Clostridium perfringens]